MSLYITLIRHGETPYILDRSYLNIRNAPLTPYGCLKASTLTGQYDTVIVSPMLRTKMTFESSQITATNIIYDTRVREQKLCVCDFIEDENLVYERPIDLTSRCCRFYEYLRTNFLDKRVCIITHGNWIMEFVHALRYPLDHYPANCEVIQTF
jgi:hypothetical protein